MIIKPKGTRDIIKKASLFRFVENTFIKLATNFNYSEIRTPIFENALLFNSTIGEDSDIVQKELYQFKDKGNRSLALRPEGTAPVVRAFIENKLHVENSSTKFFYLGRMFRYERPQKGRRREFNQLGIEQIGLANPFTNAEAIILANKFLETLNIKNYNIVLNNLGSVEDREKYQKELKKYFSPKLNTLCQDCQKRFETNPLRLLDCKNDKTGNDVPKIIDYVNDNSSHEFNKLITLLKQEGIKVIIDPTLVRGLDYYSNAVFEFIPQTRSGSQSTIIAGGEYSGLVKKLMGPDVKGVGFAAGVERIIELLEEQDLPMVDNNIDVFVLGEENNDKIFKTVNTLRNHGIKVEFDSNFPQLKKQFKKSDKLKAKWAIIISANGVKLKAQRNEKVFEGSIQEMISIIKEDM